MNAIVIFTSPFCCITVNLTWTSTFTIQIWQPSTLHTFFYNMFVLTWPPSSIVTVTETVRLSLRFSHIWNTVLLPLKIIQGCWYLFFPAASYLHTVKKKICVLHNWQWMKIKKCRHLLGFRGFLFLVTCSMLPRAVKLERKHNNCSKSSYTRGWPYEAKTPCTMQYKRYKEWTKMLHIGGKSHKWTQ